MSCFSTSQLPASAEKSENNNIVRSGVRLARVFVIGILGRLRDRVKFIENRKDEWNVIRGKDLFADF